MSQPGSLPILVLACGHETKLAERIVSLGLCARAVNHVTSVIDEITTGQQLIIIIEEDTGNAVARQRLKILLEPAENWRVPILIAINSPAIGKIDQLYRAGASDVIDLSESDERLSLRLQFAQRAVRRHRRAASIDAAIAAEDVRSDLATWEWIFAEKEVAISEPLRRMIGAPMGTYFLPPADLFALVHDEDKEETSKAFRGARDHGIIFDIRHRAKTAKNDWRMMRLRISPLFGESNEVIGLRGLTEDIETVVERDRFLSHYDRLTGLANQSFLLSHVERALSNPAPSARRAAILIINIERFARLNTVYGRAGADDALRSVARRLDEALSDFSQLRAPVMDGDCGLVARLGGAEFAVLLRGPIDNDEAIGFAEDLLNAFETPVRIDGHDVFISLRVGIALAADKDESAPKLLDQASSALAEAKAQDYESYRLYSPDFQLSAQMQQAQETALRRAIDDDRLDVVYQPQMDLNEGRFGAVEALIRWPEIDGISTGNFIEIAETSELILEVGERVLDRTLADLAVWRHQGLRDIKLSINLSAAQFYHPHTAKMVVDALRYHDLPPDQICIELTETVIAKDVHATAKTMWALREEGVLFAIDDFGTGYSSLNYLRRFPFDTLKIDKSFVGVLPGKAQDLAVLQAILSLAKSLGMSVVAEGVETEAQLNTLRDLGCRQFQGYYFAKPMGEAEIGELLLASLPISEGA